MSLAWRLRELIARNGPMPVDRFMEACLLDPQDGYYRRREAIGAAGDFVTAPEISQVFGELLGLWAAVAWQQMGKPRPIRLVEIGPGRGTMMADALRALRAVPEMLRALEVRLVETSPALAAIQRRTLAASPVPIAWSGADAVPGGAAIVLANEVLDALPVRQVVRRGAGWRERAVGLDGSGSLAFVDGAAADPPGGLEQADEGAIVELRDWPADALPFSFLARRTGAPLAALFIDYGHEGAAVGETLQAVGRHVYEDPLARPGEADLSAHVEFGAFLESGRRAGLEPYGSIPQAQLLASLGIAERAERLMHSAPPRILNEIETAIARLIDPRGMGGRFRAAALLTPGLPAPPGFERDRMRA
jgi:SAM-dependent MidA family methyltransferase